MNYQSKIIFYDHHVLMFGSKAQDILLANMLITTTIIYKLDALNVDEYLGKLFLKIYCKNTLQEERFAKQKNFVKIFEEQNFKNFKILNILLSKGIYFGFLFEMLLWPIMTNKFIILLCEQSNESSSIKQIYLCSIYLFNSCLYHIAFYTMGKYSEYVSTIVFFFIFIMKTFFKKMQEAFQNSNENIAKIRQTYYEGIAIFFRINSSIIPIVFCIIFNQSPTHALLMIETFFGKHFNINSGSSLFLISVFMFFIQIYVLSIRSQIRKGTRAAYSRLVLSVFDKSTTRMTVIREKITSNIFISTINSGFFFTYGRYGQITVVYFYPVKG